MSELDDVVWALRNRREVAEWVASTRARTIARVRHGAGELRRLDLRGARGAIVHRDLPAGRGSARVRTSGGPIAPAIDDAVDRAGFALGPAWQMAPPAAPAQVDTLDPAVAEPLEDVAELIATRAYAAARAPELARLAGGPIAIADVAVEVALDTIDVASSQGLHVQWRASELHVAVLASSGDRTAVVRARARTIDGLGLAEAFAAAAERLGARGAGPPPAGTYPIVLRLDALAPADGGLGLWAAFASQADASLVRQGLSRYRAGRPIAPDAAAAEPITVVSDGTLRFGPASAPLGDDASPVRRFALVERGVAREIAYDQREAALAGARPNGGVRNLVVSPGAVPAAAIADGARLDVASLAWIELDPHTADFSAGIELAWLHDDGGARPITGGVIRGDAIAALAGAARTIEAATRGAYQGPIALRTPPLDVA